MMKAKRKKKRIVQEKIYIRRNKIYEKKRK